MATREWGRAVTTASLSRGAGHSSGRDPAPPLDVVRRVTEGRSTDSTRRTPHAAHPVADPTESRVRRRSHVSVVIPVKDDAAYLRRCLAALSVQSRAPREVVVVDNGSRDRSRRVARRYGARLVRERRPGIPAAASRGYDAARGRVIARLDADSVPGHDWVARIERAFAEDRALGALTGPGEFPTLSPRRRRIAGLLYMEAYFRLFGAMLGQPPVFGSNFALRRRVWRAVRRRVHRRDRRVHDDLDLSIHLAGRAVRFDPDLRVAVSSRPLRTPRGVLRRLGMGFWTVGRNAPALVALWRGRSSGRG